MLMKWFKDFCNNITNNKPGINSSKTNQTKQLSWLLEALGQEVSDQLLIQIVIES